MTPITHMDTFLKLEDVMEVVNLCRNIECKDCCFENTLGPDCKLILWVDGLKKYEMKMVEMK